MCNSPYPKIIKRLILLVPIHFFSSCESQDRDAADMVPEPQESVHHTIDWVGDDPNLKLSIEISSKIDDLLSRSDEYDRPDLVSAWSSAFTSVSRQRFAPVGCILRAGSNLSIETPNEQIVGFISKEGVLCTLDGRPRLNQKDLDQFLKIVREVAPSRFPLAE